MLQSKFALTVFLLAAVGTANADYYKCKDKSGRTVFSDTPCGAGVRVRETDSASSLPQESQQDTAEDMKYGDRPDLLVCPGDHGNTLPAKLCDSSQATSCYFKFEYLQNLLANANDLKNDITESQANLIEKNVGNGDELWEFGTPGSDWDSGTGIRGYVVLRRLKATFYLAVLYQGIPNKSPDGGARYLPLKGRPTRCENRNIMSVE